MSNRFATDLLRAIDPVVLARDVGITPHDYQAVVLRSRSRQLILNWSRQSGKSSATAILPLHIALYTPKSLTLILAPSDRQGGLLLDMVYDYLHRLGWRAAFDEKENTRMIRLGNGSEIWALPGKEGTIRGFSGVDLLVIDEASKVPDPLYYAVRPMLAASGGRIVLLSTPFGERGFFYDVWHTGEAWEKHYVPVEQVPHIDPAFIASERRELPPEWFDQEYRGRFIPNTSQLFAGELIDALVSSDVEPLWASEEPAWSKDLLAGVPAL